MTPTSDAEPVLRCQAEEAAGRKRYAEAISIYRSVVAAVEDEGIQVHEDL